MMERKLKLDRLDDSEGIPEDFVIEVGKWRKLRQTISQLESYYPVLCYLVTIFLISLYFDNNLPPPLMLKDFTADPGSFNTERAKGYLDRLTNIGPRPSGSYECEVRVADGIRRELEIIRHLSNPINLLEIDVQKTSGAFTSGFLNGHVSVYQQVTNVIAKIGPNGTTTDGVLVNCHFDSVAGSPGASDNMLWCAVMLEALEVMSRQRVPLKNSIVFLFNGAEENGLQAAHGFIQQHRWKDNIKAFINLDSCGAGGRDILFQMDPRHNKLFEAYASAAPYPFGNVFGQEVFEYGLIPSDTDYRIFRDFGKIPGLDFAFFKNGYVYHTKHDSVDKIPLGTIQRAGSNILSLLRTLAVADLDQVVKETSDGFVFFDILGLVMIRYSGWFATFLNGVIFIVLIFQTWKYVAWQKRKTGVIRQQVLLALGCSALTSALSYVTPIVTAWILAQGLHAFKASMTWYAKPWLVLPLFCFPTLYIVPLLYEYSQKLLTKIIGYSTEHSFIQFRGLMLFVGVLTLGLASVGIRSSVLFLLYLLAALTLTELWQKYVEDRRFGEWLAWIIPGVFLLPSAQTLYIGVVFMSVLIPVAGRSGPHANPDVIVGCVSAFISVVVVSVIAPVAVLRRPLMKVAKMFMLVTVVVYLLVLFTPFGFPYSGSVSNLAPQRIHVMHVEKIEWSQNGRILHRDSGFWLPPLDVYGPTSLTSYVPELANLKTIDEENCRQEPYCGVPYYFPSLKRIRKSYWLSAPPPPVYLPTRLVLESNRHVTVDTRRLVFTVTGTDHMAAIIRPNFGVDLVGWSFNTSSKPTPDPFDPDHPVYFAYFGSGSHGEKWNFSIDLKLLPTRNSKDHMVEVVITSHFLHGEEQFSKELRDFINKFPDFTYTYGWVATYSTSEQTLQPVLFQL